MPNLSDAQFKETFRPPMRQLPPESSPPFDFWSYVDGISSADYSGHICQGDVSYVWEDSSGKFQHVLLNSQDKNVFMAVVLDLSEGKVFGHHLLDLNELYGFNEA